MTGQKEQLWKDAKQQVEGIRTLSDGEVAAKKEEIAGIDAQYKVLKDSVDVDRAKLQWIKTDWDLAKAIDKATEEHKQAQSVVDSDDFKTKELLVRQWNTTIDARSWLTAKKVLKAARYNSRRLCQLWNRIMSVCLAGMPFQSRRSNRRRRTSRP